MAHSTGEGELLEVHLDGGPRAAAVAREAVAAADGSVPAAVRDDVLLLVTELITNAVRHAGARPGSGVDLSMAVSARGVRVEVADGGGGFTRGVTSPRPRDGGGWGLYLVDRLADDWGVESTASGTSVWFDLQTPR
ncbi:MAG: ATP-binding protein [Thermoleophilaceae bacterium]|nr:ATP-binding protein [Thermoleophilaceae bacterium]